MTERDDKTIQKVGWCDEHGHETVECMRCRQMWCPEPGHGCACPDDDKTLHPAMEG